MTTDPLRATFTPQSGSMAGQAITVHFNPEKLQIDISNTLEDKAQGKEKKQYVTKSSAKLAMELIFDSTADGSDVRLATGKIAKLMEPGKAEGEQGAPPCVVLFEWGAFKFQGLIDSYRESLDFFSSNGVPLRASVSLTMASQDKVFERLGQGDSAKKAEPLVHTLSPAGESLTALASRVGHPGAGRALAAANDLESMRLATGPIAISASIPLAPPIAFTTPRLSGGGLGGLAANLGPRSARAPAPRLNLEKLRRPPAAISTPIGDDDVFEVGGLMASQGSAGLRADVGVSRGLQRRVRFL
jgi:hypothetical protein